MLHIRLKNVFLVLLCACTAVLCGSIAYMALMTVRNESVTTVTIPAVIVPALVVPEEDQQPTNPFFSHQAFESSTHPHRRVPAPGESHSSTDSNPLSEGSSSAQVSSLTVPVSYTSVAFQGVDDPVYVFVDTEGKYQYRVRVAQQEQQVFVRAVPGHESGRICLVYDPEDTPVNVKDEPFGIITPEEAPTDILTTLQKVYGFSGLYCRAGDDGMPEYYRYGRYPGGRPSFFVADEAGQIIPGVLPAEIT